MGTNPSSGLVTPYLLAALAAVLAVVLARRRPEHRPVALFLSVMLVVDVARYALRAGFDLGAPGPYEGLRRAAFHLDELGFTSWPAGLAALALVVFGGRRPWPAFAAWAALGLGLIALYPSPLVRTEGLQRVYLATYLVALLTVLATIVRWGWDRRMPGSPHAVIFVLFALDLARLLAFRGSIFEQWSAYSLPTNAVCYGLISAVEGGYLWSPRS